MQFDVAIWSAIETTDNGLIAFDGVYIHCSLLKAVVWMLNTTVEMLARLPREHNNEFKLVFSRHALGASVATLMARIAVKYLNRFGEIERSRTKKGGVSDCNNFHGL